MQRFLFILSPFLHTGYLDPVVLTVLVLIIVAILVIIAVCCWRRHRKKRSGRFLQSNDTSLHPPCRMLEWWLMHKSNHGKLLKCWVLIQLFLVSANNDQPQVLQSDTVCDWLCRKHHVSDWRLFLFSILVIFISILYSVSFLCESLILLKYFLKSHVF